MKFGRYICCCVFVVVCCLARGENDFFLVKSYNSYWGVYCVTNTSFAMSWIIDDTNEQLDKASSEFLPKQTSTFDCEIGKDSPCTNDWAKGQWTLMNSLTGPINDIITDRRWEDIKEIYTIFEDRDRANLRFYAGSDVELNHNFEIPFSIRIEKEAHIFLCDGVEPQNSNCYWFMLQAWKGNSTAIRKCKRGKIPHRNLVYPDGDCAKLRNIKNHTSDLPHYITNTAWTHLKLRKTENNFAILRENDKVPIIDYYDNEPQVFSVKNIILHGKMANGLWRIQEYEYVYTEEIIKKLQMGSTIYQTSDQVCISMFVKMCDTCSLKLSLSNEDESSIYKEKNFKSLIKWAEIKFITENVQSPTKLLITTASTRSGENFWAIDAVRLCQNQEIRKIHTKKTNSKCQLLSEGAGIISIQRETVRQGSSCPTETITPLCVPCNWFYQNCERVTICEKSEDSESKCYCSAGYEGYDCYYGCNKGYGHGCEKECGKCKDSGCNEVDGHCSRGLCKGGYTGPKCDIPSEFVFEKVPEILNHSYTSCTVKVNSEGFKYESVFDTPDSFIIQFKKADDSTSKWEKKKSEDLSQINKSIFIGNLEADTKYFVRALVVGISGHIYGDDTVMYAVFKTSCEDVKEENIIIKPSNTSINIEYIMTAVSCKIQNYHIHINNVHSRSMNNNYAYFDGLEPYKDYTLIIERNEQKIEKKFKTKEGVPSEVTDLRKKMSGATSIELEWNEPSNPNGIIIGYKVRYKHIAYIACGRDDLDATILAEETTDTSILLSNLLPNSNYKFKVSAMTNSYEGSDSSLIINTSWLEYIEKHEVPEILNLSASSNSIILHVSPLDCTQVRGSLYIDIIATCNHLWCGRKQIERFSHNFFFHPIITLNNAYPFSNYTVWMRLCRNSIVCTDIIKDRIIRTQPAVSNPVSDLLVYTKDDNSVSLRWSPPYPPTGILKGFKVEYSCGFYCVDRVTTVSNSPCKLWPELQCTKLEKLNKYDVYKIKVYASNVEPPIFGDSKEVTARPQKGVPDDPYDLHAEWTFENDLILSWKHPNVTNGDLTSFIIRFSPLRLSSFEESLSIGQEDYNLTYYYKANHTMFTESRQYKFFVKSYNGYASSGHISVKDYSPPPIPLLENDPTFTTTNDTITIEFVVKKIQSRDINSFKIFFLIHEDQAGNPDLELQNVMDYFKISLSKFKLLHKYQTQNTNRLKSFTIESTNKTLPKADSISENYPLKPGTPYNISILLLSSFMNKTRYKIYSSVVQTMGQPSSSFMANNLYALLLLLLMIPICFILWRKREPILLRLNKHTQRNSIGEKLSSEENILLSASTPNQVDQKPEVQKPIVAKKPTVNNEKVFSKCVKITDFENYIKESIANGELSRQHALFPRGHTKPCEYGALKSNKSKNRYNNLIAYDHSRVILTKIPGDEHSDYINASYIEGYRTPKAYIATQGPKAVTINDFWRMVWQENVKHIVMLANIHESGKKKVEKYWPVVNEELKFGDISVRYLSHQVFADYEFRVFNVTQGQEARKVDQIHFVSWPDHSVPLYSQSLVPILQRMLKLPLSSKSPIVIHCSAGVGRTGTVILCDICLRMAANEGSVDVLRYLQKIRSQRANMVDNIEQYKLVHLVVLECLVGMRTSISCNEIEEAVRKIIDNGGVSSQMRYLKDTVWQDQAMKAIALTEEPLPIVREKNRFQHILPEDQGRVFISRYPTNDENSSYINAVKVDGFRSPGRFIVTQQPMPNTLGDFWRLLDESDVSVLVSLNEINKSDKTSCQFWPTEENPSIKPVDYLTVIHRKTMSLEDYDLITVKVDKNGEEERTVEIIAMKKWPSKDILPKSPEQFLTFLEEASALSRRSNQIIVTCYDGVTASGLYLAMSFIIEKINLEQTCDVCLAVRTIRHNRSQFIENEKQFTFLYEGAVKYVNGFQSYANFN